MDSAVTGDFIFGTLGTDELRLTHEQSRLHGLWHGSRISPVDPKPGDTITFTVSVGVDTAVERIELLLTRDGSHPRNASEIIDMQQNSTEWSTLAWGYRETWTCQIPAQVDELWRYSIRGVTANDEMIWADVHSFTSDPGIFAVSIDQLDDPAWFKRANIYQVFVDRFARGDGLPFEPRETLMDIWGGTLRGVIDHLPYIKQLGVNAIWLSPISPSPTHHGYDVIDYTAIEPRLGTMADFDELLAKAHGLGLRVILDFVASHCSNLHPTFAKALRDSGAPEREIFLFDADGGYDSFFGVQEMPRINGDNDVAATWLIDAAKFWVERGVDGFRLDYAIGQSLQFWTRFRRELRFIKPDLVLVAEAVDSAETLQSYRGRLDGVLDFLFLEKVRSFIGFEKESAVDFWRFLERHQRWFAEGPVRATFLDNHDMNRLLWVLQGDTERLKLAAMLQMSLPSATVTYYGTEVGLSQWHDLEYPDGSRRMEESRTPMLWGDDADRDVQEFYRSLLFWRDRHGIAALTPSLVHAGDDGTLIYRIDPWLVLLNRSDDEIEIALGSYGSLWLMLATNNTVRLHGSRLILSRYSGAVLGNEHARPGMR
ncbi:MAG: alpha-amylase family glycosyl hydrolase [Thermomicrobiales bacterium]|nr:alpha-amylase family glycosyl hydrolase [Thermomicrobiales bacterium]